jgi:regulator of protease activity HflC (stomatin/prohibitin superfamily)
MYERRSFFGIKTGAGLVVLVLFIFIIFITVGCNKVPAGNVGIKFYLLGKSKGVDTEVLSPGRYLIGINEELHLFPTFKQEYVWTADEREGSPNDESITFQTKEGMAVTADVGVVYHIIPDKVPQLFQNYKKGIEEITDRFLRNSVRDSFVSIASRYKVETVYGEGKEKLLEEVTVDVKKEFDRQGIIVEKIFVIGKFKLPQQVTNALNRKIEAIQRAEQREFELRESQAEAKKRITLAEADAKVLRLKAQTITPLMIQYEAIKKWDGKLPTVQSGNTPFININKLKQ